MIERNLEALAANEWDLLVVGGGIYGACAAREAATRGLRVALIERDDFGHATSSHSLRVLHGGLRYLQHADVRRLRESVRERNVWLRTAPHLVSPLPCVLPTRGRGLRGRFAMAAALQANEWLSRGTDLPVDPARRPPAGGLLSREETLALCEGIDAHAISGGARWWDAQAFSSERLLFAVIASAAAAGARVANHLGVAQWLRRGERVIGVTARDALGGASFDVRARLTLLATGPFVDQTLAAVAPPRSPLYPLSKAINLLLRRTPGTTAFGLEWQAAFHDEDALLRAGTRLFFAVPWRGMTLVGTQHLPFEGEPEAFAVTRDEVDRMLAEIAAAWPGARVSPDDVVAVYAGMLPRSAGSATRDVQLAKRARLIDHRRAGIDGLISLVGVKWTTARIEAERALDHVIARLGHGTASRTARLPLAGGEIVDFAAFLAAGRAARDPAISIEAQERLLRAYGTRHTAVSALAHATPELARPIACGSPVLRAELVHAAREEMALRLSDAVLRRTELPIEGAVDDGVLADAAALVGGVHGWDEARTQAEIDLTRDALRRLRAAPA